MDSNPVIAKSLLTWRSGWQKGGDPMACRAAPAGPAYGARPTFQQPPRLLRRLLLRLLLRDQTTTGPSVRTSQGHRRPQCSRRGRRSACHHSGASPADRRSAWLSTSGTRSGRPRFSKSTLIHKLYNEERRGFRENSLLLQDVLCCPHLQGRKILSTI